MGEGKKLPGRPDIVLAKYKTVVFVDGCFWHGHEGCRYFRLPKSNVEFWQSKIERNVARDARNEAELTAMGWRVIRVWECDIRPVSGRQEYLDNLYDRITGDKLKNSEPLPYSEPDDQEYDIAAEDEAQYGNG